MSDRPGSDRPAKAGLWKRAAAAPALALCLLGGVFADKLLFHTPPADAAPYHERIRAAAAAGAVPKKVGPWVGEDVEVPAAAVALLHPNVILSRQYRNTQTNKSVSFLLVQCSDARDILGHYPPVCYRAHGWTQVSAEPADWQVDGVTVRGTRYQFETTRLDRSARIAIDNYMLLPDGQTCRDMAGVTESAQDARRKFFGAAQVQLVSDGTLTAAERGELVALFFRASRPLFDQIMTGVLR